MTETLTLPPEDHGTVRVFALDADPERPEAWQAPANGGGDPLARAFGADRLDRAYVEVIRIADLAGMSLPDYLAQGYRVAEAALAPHRAALSALDGLAVIALSSAFTPPDAAPTGAPLTLAPDPRLSLVAELRDPEAKAA